MTYLNMEREVKMKKTDDPDYYLKYYRKNKKKLDERAKQWRYSHPIKTKLQEKISAQWKRDNPKATAKFDRKHKLKARYGISDLEYNIIFKLQNGRCKICKVHQSKLKRSLAVDHDHKTGLVRGLLCTRCNLGLGCFEDNIDNLMRSIEYLKEQEGVS